MNLRNDDWSKLADYSQPIFLKTQDNLIIQSIDKNYARYLNLSLPVHSQYAQECAADYWFLLGNVDPYVHPAWNRIKMILDAFDAGYKRVVWIDADALVVKFEDNIFAIGGEDEGNYPIHLMWAGMEWKGEDSYNDGVIVADNHDESRKMFEWVWDKRREPLLPHHVPSLWESNWLLDYALDNRDKIEYLHPKWNWMPFADNIPREDAAIMAWHGMPHNERFMRFAETWNEFYGNTEW